MRLKTVIFFVVFLKISTRLFAQDPAVVNNPPIIVEPMLGAKGMYIQSFYNKRSRTVPSLGIVSLSGISGNWDQSEIKEVMLQSYLNYKLYDQWSVSSGFIYNHIEGIRPTAGVMYNYVSEKWLVTAFPRIDLIKNPNVETFAMVEFKPKIGNEKAFYSRLQGTYIYHLTERHHQRSYLYARAGFTFREFTVGGALNVDYFGPGKINENNTGLFINIQLF